MKWERLAAGGLAAMLIVVLGGCGFFKPALETGERGEVLQPQNIGVDLQDTLDNTYAKIAKRIPGFGGAFLSPDGTLNVYFSRPPSLSAIKEAATVLGVLHGDWLIPQESGKIRVLQGQYDFAQLKRWLDLLEESVWGIPWVVMTDISDGENRLVVGVETLKMKGSIEQELDKYGIPREAVIIKEFLVPELLSSTLRDRVRPMVSGLIIRGEYSLACTMGPIVSRGGVRGFLTNSHCTKTMAGLDNERFSQPDRQLDAPQNFVGYEAVDPLPYTGGDCPAGLRCRRSDSVFVRFDLNASGRLGDIRNRLGIIARTEAPTSRLPRDPDNNPIYPITILGDFATVYTIFQPIAGQRLWKTGRVTGLTWGTVDSNGVCFNMTLREYNIHLRCQTRVVGESGPGSYPEIRIAAKGDSGSTVFAIRASNPSTVILYGMVWGADPAVGSEFYFSSLNRITADLGSMIFVPGF